MSNDLLAGAQSEDFNCPVCRARQQPSAKCRRCQADLTLAMKARQRLWYLRTLPSSEENQAEIAALIGPGKQK